MNRFIKFLSEVKKEALNVTWPDKRDMIISIFIVSISVLLAGSVFFAADYMLYNAVQYLIRL